MKNVLDVIDIKFSIIIPVYNVDQYIENAVKSVLSQSIDFLQYGEIILINDGSTDGSGKICKSYIAIYPNNIKYIEQKHKGVSSARNRGLDIAKGMLIGFLDADDYYSDKVLQNVLDAYRRNQEKASIITLPLTIVNEISDTEKNFGVKQNKLLNVKNTGMINYSCTRCFFHRKIISDIRFDENVIIFEDKIFTVKALLKNSIVVGLGFDSGAVYFHRTRQSMDSVKQLQRYDAKYYNNIIESSRIFSSMFLPSCERYLQNFYINTFLYQMCIVSNKVRAEIFSKIKFEEIKKHILGVLSQFDFVNILKRNKLSLSSRLWVYCNFLNGQFELIEKDGLLLLCTSRNFFEICNVSDLQNSIIHIKESGRIIEIIGLYNPILSLLKNQICFFAEYKMNKYIPCHSQINSFNAYFLDETIRAGELFTFNIPYVGEGEITFGLQFDKRTYKSQIRHANMVRSSKMSNSKESFLLGESTIFKILPSEGVKGLAIKDKTFDDIKNSIEAYLSCMDVSEKTPFLCDFFNLYLKEYEKRHDKNYWLFIDVPTAADDNALHLIKYIYDNKLYRNARYVTTKGAIDRIKSKFPDSNDILVEYGSQEHLLVNMFSALNISSHSNEMELYTDIFPKNAMNHLLRLSTYKKVYLRHGVNQSDCSHWLNKASQQLSLLITTSLVEYKEIVSSTEKYGYSENIVKLTGMPRFDSLRSESEKSILLILTWRSSINTVTHSQKGIPNLKFQDTKYFKAIKNLANHSRLLDKMKQYGYVMKIRPHNLTLQNMTQFFIENDYVKLVGHEISYQELYKKAALAITDISSAIFDFAYLKKPVLYYQFPSEAHHLLHADAFDYESLGFGEVTQELDELVEYIIQYIESDCVMKDKYKERVDNFFAHHDMNNCERVYQEIIKL